VNDQLHDHPAVRAWRRARPDAQAPLLVEPLKRPNARQVKPTSRAVRLHHRQDIGPTIAKRRSRKFLEVEHLMYQQILPQLPIPQVPCLGFAIDDDPRRAWLFVEDVGGERYRNASRDHRILAARWLGTVHAFGMTMSTRALLPDRGPNHYLSELRWSSNEISSRLSRDYFTSDDRRILLATLRALSELEERWDKIGTWCNAMPHTLVHGDFVAKNCRIRKAGTPDLELAVFDWEMAGWGVPAVDLARNAFRVDELALDREMYAEAMRDAWPGLGQLELEHAVRIGDAQRVTAAVRWGCDYLMDSWIVQTGLRLYLPHLEQAVRLVRGNDGRRPRNGAAPNEAVQGRPS